MATEALGGNARVFEVSSRRVVAPSWKNNASALERARQRREEARRAADTVQVLQEFEFPTVSQRVKCTEDGKHIVAIGTYPPMMKTYELSELSLKFQRNLDCEIVDFQLLTEDWRKVAFLLADRYVELHAQFGRYFRLRVPKFGRDLALHRSSAELYICGEGSEIWRLNLDQGRFVAPLVGRSGADDDDDDGGNNCLGINPVNDLIATGGSSGLVEVWDPRDFRQGSAGCLDVGAGISALRFDERDGLTIALGTEEGQTILYDLRSSRPLAVHEQGYGLPIHSIRLHGDGRHVLASDSRSIKAWRRDSSDGGADGSAGGATRSVFTIEPRAAMNHLCTVGASGLLIAAAETPRVLSYYVPMLGAAPKWCSFLDTVADELEDDGASAAGSGDDRGVYDNYHFVTLEELRQLQLDHLIGTPLLRGYMHGYFMDVRLWRRAVDAAKPFAYEKYRKEKARERVESERASRIGAGGERRAELGEGRSVAKRAKVNKEVAERALARAARQRGKDATSAAAVLSDTRFHTMFENADFAVDESDQRYQQLHAAALGRDRAAGAAQRAVEDAEVDSDDSNSEGAALMDRLREDDGPRERQGEDDDEEYDDDDDDAKDDNGGAIVQKRDGSARKKRALAHVPRIRAEDHDDALEDAPSAAGGKARQRRRSNELTLGERIDRQRPEPRRQRRSSVR